MSEFKPKQWIELQPWHYVELVGDINMKASQQCLEKVLKKHPFSDDDVIHDNACGTGAMTELIMNENPEIHIEATDIDPNMLAGCTEMAEKNKWDAKVKTAVMSAQELDPNWNEKFTFSFTSFAFHCIGDSDKAAQEIYRTLKPGGVAVATVWSEMDHVRPSLEAHEHTRGKSPKPSKMHEDFGKEQLREALVHGGFKDGNIIFEEMSSSLVIQVSLERWATLNWSYLGMPPGGWTQEDEDKWDEAIKKLVEKLDALEKKDGKTVLYFKGCIAIATK